MLERLLCLGYLIFAVADGALRGLPHPSHPMTTPTPHPIRQQATLRYFRRIDELDNNIAYRPLTSDFTTDLY
jgi:hypothetical protein